jgi:predicted phage-related endonuclease
MTPGQHAERRTRIGGSDAPKIVEGKWHELWLEKTGRSEPEELFWVLPVQIGIITEPLNIAFFERATGQRVFARGSIYTHPDYAFIGATLDGLVLVGEEPTIVQCKHVSAFAKIEEVEQRYFPQVMHECLTTGAPLGFLSVLVGTHKHEIIECRRDGAYVARLLELEREFWRFVEADVPPPDRDPIPVPPKPEEWRTVDFAGSNSWAVAAADWLGNRDSAKRFDQADKALKSLIEPDVGKAFGAGIVATRNKAGAITIRAAR